MKWLINVIVNHRRPRFRYGVRFPRFVLWEKCGGRVSKASSKARQCELERYLCFAVRNEAAAVIARFHQYDKAVEFAALTIASAAGGNAASRGHRISVEWIDDNGKPCKQTLLLTVVNSEVRVSG